jgi:hypothetical protein
MAFDGMKRVGTRIIKGPTLATQITALSEQKRFGASEVRKVSKHFEKVLTRYSAPETTDAERAQIRHQLQNISNSLARFSTMSASELATLSVEHAKHSARSDKIESKEDLNVKLTLFSLKGIIGGFLVSCYESMLNGGTKYGPPLFAASLLAAVVGMVRAVLHPSIKAATEWATKDIEKIHKELARAKEINDWLITVIPQQSTAQEVGEALNK